MKLHKKAFTLVELIVVIVILAILASIAFINLQSYPKDARDTVRKTDVGTIEKSLTLHKLKTGELPTPDEATETTADGWVRGVFGNTSYETVKNLDKLPTDPVTGEPYGYEVSEDGEEFRIITELENGGSFSSDLSDTTSGENNELKGTCMETLTIDEMKEIYEFQEQSWAIENLNEIQDYLSKSVNEDNLEEKKYYEERLIEEKNKLCNNGIYLEIQSNYISEPPNSLTKLNNLEVNLIMYDETIPSFLGDLNIKKFSISGDDSYINLKNIDFTILQLSELEKLRLEHGTINFPVDLFDSIKFTNLEELGIEIYNYREYNANGDEIPTVSNTYTINFDNLPNLKNLYIRIDSSDNFIFKGIPKVLESAYLENIEVPEELYESNNLQRLHIEHANISNNINKLSDLTFLKLKNTNIPDAIGDLSKLETLDLSSWGFDGNNIILPNTVNKLTNLKSLNLSYNYLTSLPPQVLTIPNLETLRITHNKIRDLPADIVNMTNLKRLDMNYIMLDNITLPSIIGYITNLEYLSLEHNQGSRYRNIIPTSYTNLSKLKTLRLPYNLTIAADGGGYTSFSNNKRCDTTGENGENICIVRGEDGLIDITIE